MDKLVSASKPNYREKCVSLATRRYPLKSGCGTIADSRVIKLLAGRRSANLWADIEGGKALVPIDDLVGRAMFFCGDLDPKVSCIIDRFVRPDDVALDIGANLGLVTLRLAARVGSRGKVHSFEPNPKMASYLRATLEKNAEHPISVHPVALGADEAEMVLKVPRVNAGAGSLVDLGNVPAAYEVRVAVKRLTDYAAHIGIDRIDFIKIDVEGFEAQVLSGGKDIIEKLLPRAILLEEHGEIAHPNVPLSLSLLISLGYSIYCLPKRFFKVEMIPLEKMGTLKSNDFVAVRQNFL